MTEKQNNKTNSVIKSVALKGIIGELYHGTITPFTSIDPSKGQPYKDFGRGFYVGVDRTQAVGIADCIC